VPPPSTVGANASGVVADSSKRSLRSRHPFVSRHHAAAAAAVETAAAVQKINAMHGLVRMVVLVAV
jgi:hypothetical protein